MLEASLPLLLEASWEDSACGSRRLLQATLPAAPGDLSIRAGFPWAWPVGALAEHRGRESVKVGHWLACALPVLCLRDSRGPSHLAGQDCCAQFSGREGVTCARPVAGLALGPPMAPPHTICTL